MEITGTLGRGPIDLTDGARLQPHPMAASLRCRIPDGFWSACGLCVQRTHLHCEPLRDAGRPYRCLWP